MTRTIVVLVSGSDKAAAVRAALDGPDDVRQWPAQLLRAAGDRAPTFDSGGTPERSLGESLKTLGYLSDSNEDQ